MEPAKQVFAKTTENLIAEFVNVCELFAAKFREEGPGAEQNDLEQGFNLKIVSSNLSFRVIVIISDNILNTLYFNIIDSFVFSWIQVVLKKVQQWNYNILTQLNYYACTLY